MKSNNLFFVFPIIFCLLCKENLDKIGSEKLSHGNSYELNGVSLDTINMTDQNGLKQGIWKPSPTNNLNDTILYKNDSIIKQY